MISIENPEAAALVANHLQAAFKSLEDSLVVVREYGSEAEIKEYTSKVGDLFYGIIFKMMEPLYMQHAELAPEGWELRETPMDPD